MKRFMYVLTWSLLFSIHSFGMQTGSPSIRRQGPRQENQQQETQYRVIVDAIKNSRKLLTLEQENLNQNVLSDVKQKEKEALDKMVAILDKKDRYQEFIRHFKADDFNAVLYALQKGSQEFIKKKEAEMKIRGAKSEKIEEVKETFGNFLKKIARDLYVSVTKYDEQDLVELTREMDVDSYDLLISTLILNSKSNVIEKTRWSDIISLEDDKREITRKVIATCSEEEYGNLIINCISSDNIAKAEYIIKNFPRNILLKDVVLAKKIITRAKKDFFARAITSISKQVIETITIDAASIILMSGSDTALNVLLSMEDQEFKRVFEGNKKNTPLGVLLQFYGSHREYSKESNIQNQVSKCLEKAQQAGCLKGVLEAQNEGFNLLMTTAAIGSVTLVELILNKVKESPDLNLVDYINQRSFQSIFHFIKENDFRINSYKSYDSRVIVEIKSLGIDPAKESWKGRVGRTVFHWILRFTQGAQAKEFPLMLTTVAAELFKTIFSYLKDEESSINLTIQDGTGQSFLYWYGRNCGFGAITNQSFKDLRELFAGFVGYAQKRNAAGPTFIPFFKGVCSVLDLTFLEKHEWPNYERLFKQGLFFYPGTISVVNIFQPEERAGKKHAQFVSNLKLVLLAMYQPIEPTISNQISQKFGFELNNVGMFSDDNSRWKLNAAAISGTIVNR